MKNSIKFIKGLSFALIALLLVTSCKDDDDNNNTPDPVAEKKITEFVSESKDHTLLLKALEKAELVDVLAGEGPFTVFAPNDAAFTAFLKAKDIADLDAVDKATLKEILLNHVVDGSAKSTDLKTGYDLKTKSTSSPNQKNLSLYVDTTNGVKLNGTSTVTGKDNMMTNGVVHLVDAVIDLPTVVTFATADPNFSTLATALQTDGLATDFVSILSTANGTAPAPFTVFAPTNEAFAALLTELGKANLTEVDIKTLEAALKLHAVSGKNYLASDLSDDMAIATLGGEIAANVTDGATLTDTNGRISKITATDVQTSNGVLHVIDKVILPTLNGTKQ